MVPPLTDVPHDHTEFDLDVRLHPAGREVSLGSAYESGQGASCGCPSVGDVSCPPKCGP